MKGHGKGVILTYTLQTATNKNYIITFVITHQNEDKENWDFANKNLKDAILALLSTRNDSMENDITEPQL